MSDQLDVTPEQERAIHEHDANLVVVAGAGSGKTRVLVERYLSLLEKNDWPVDSLVAITFTEKAAREMRDRVRLGVEQRAEAARRSGNAELARRWSDHRSALDFARISTIHSLCASLLRRFPAEAGIAPGFRVLEEIDAALLREKSISEVLADLEEEGGDELELFSHYDASDIVAALKNLMESGSVAVDQMAQLPDSPEVLYKRWLEWQQMARQKTLNELWKDPGWYELVEWLLHARAADPDDKLEAVRVAAASCVPYARGPDLADAPGALAEMRSAINLTSGRAAAWGGKDGLDEAKCKLRILRERAASAVDELGPDLDEGDEVAASLLLLWRRLHRRVLDTYQRHKEQRSAVDFDDLEQRARSLLGNPEVAERCQREIRHLLVDEFQDTSPVQRDIIYGLAMPKKPGRLFVVGDPKQSIYSFRGADVSLFHQVQSHLCRQGGRELNLSRSFRAHHRLVESFNTVFAGILGTEARQPHEVAFGPKMSAFRSTREEHGPVIDLLLVPQEEAQIVETDGGAEGAGNGRSTGHVEYFAGGAKCRDGRLGPPAGRGGATFNENRSKISADDSRRWQAYGIALRLRQMVSEGYQVWDKEKKEYRPMRYDDVAILFRSSSSFLAFEDVFKSTGLRYITVAGKGYFRRQEVWDLVNLLKTLDNPFDDLALASVLRSPMFGLSDEALFALRQMSDPSRPGHPLALAQALESPEGVPEREVEEVAFAGDVIGRLRGLSGRSSLLEILQAALRETAYLATISALEGGKRRRGNVEKLLSLARQTARNSLADFTARLAKLREQEARESEALVDTEGAVQLMTVHAAKGLEFPIVVIADASSAGRPHVPAGPLVAHPTLGYVCRPREDATGEWSEPANWLWGKSAQIEADRAEEKRVLYVAATRAQDYLMIAGQPPKSSTSKGKTRTSGSWLECYLDALACDTCIAGQGCGEENLEHDWGTVKVRWLTPPTGEAPGEGAEDVEGGTPEDRLSEDAFAFALPVAEDPLALLTNISATELAELGSGPGQLSLEQLANDLRVRERVVPMLARERAEPYVSGLKVGEIAHRALEQWRLPSRTPRLIEVLRSFAWQQDLTNPGELDLAASLAHDLLTRFERSSLCREMRHADDTRRHEVPFVFNRNGRIVRGSIDALFRRPSGRWVVVDFKTDYLPGGVKALESGVGERYLLQVGIYAQAVEELIGETPVVLLHFIRHFITFPVPEAAWRSRIESLGL